MNESIHAELSTCVVRDLLLQRAAQVPERPWHYRPGVMERLGLGPEQGRQSILS